MSEPERIPEWAMREAEAMDLPYAMPCPGADIAIARALAEAYVRGKWDGMYDAVGEVRSLERNATLGESKHDLETFHDAIVAIRTMYGDRPPGAAAIRAGGV